MLPVTEFEVDYTTVTKQNKKNAEHGTNTSMGTKMKRK